MLALVPYLVALGLSVALLIAGAVFDGAWDFASFIWMAGVVAVLDHILPEHEAPPSEAAAKTLTVILAAIHFPMLALAVWALAQGGPLWNWIAYFSAAGLFFGQIMNSCAHELIHARGWIRRGLGRWTYITLLFGHQTTAHPGIHHSAVATPEDPNTARYNETWWRFVLRAWRDSFRKGLALEKRRQRAAGRHGWNWRNPYWQYLLGAAGSLALAGTVLGWSGVGAYIALCLLAQSQLLITDYVLHYGMRRVRVGKRWEPVGPQHSWNAPHVVTNLLTLHAPRHSEHHAHPSRGFEELRVGADVPLLPYSLPVMVTIALVPALWRKVMNPRVDALGQGRIVRPTEAACVA
ncbi:alkane 1-monooxygenase [Jannaschia aquimarina]|uniref:AlkB2_1 protein n=1 Tax=Jannaschia aquimarina TaxID=935700 RepID=A0A0D1EJC4_9RHOB|nr:alkane 1-monooxygenase [Jannaschia aquimarina]KIT17709.1 Alkane 1-monooxygenase 2 [Jannaschia aquimarina]SNS78489.1 alkane 1-monooxygenase [Jannaschia aquimarina]